MENFENNEEEKLERRNHRRCMIPTTFVCRFLNNDLNKNSFQGFIQDISTGGVSLEIRDDFLVIGDENLKYTKIEMVVELNMPDGAHRINIAGVIRWHRRLRKRGNMSFLYLGVEFFELNEKDRAVLNNYLALGTGDKNLIWNLWDNLSM
jgi:c-di-GMP-binding flagellar brake protein YcgR